MTLFNEQINNWSDWGRVFQSIRVFTRLIEYIFMRERLPLAEIRNLTPGTNAVFKVGGYVVKIFAPPESGIDQPLDLQTELFAIRRANDTGVSAPKLIAHGFVEDKYRFAYMITEYIDGTKFSYAVKTMSGDERIEVGRMLRAVTDKMNTPCEPFNEIDVINDKSRYRRWNKYSERFRLQRQQYIKSCRYADNVFVHGDLCGDNILLTPQGELFVIDFADAVLAPVIYEHSLVAVELFDLDPFLLRGYFGNCTAEELTQVCFDGLLIHDFGGDIIENHIGKAGEFDGLDDFRDKMANKIKNAVTV
jgi:hypothetical protein